MKRRKVISKKEDFIDYSGHVEVKLLRDRKIISSYKYHNNGRGKLFKFLCNALAGNYIERERPCQIRLFYYQNADIANPDINVAPSDFNWETLGDNDLTVASSFINYDTTPVLIRDSENDKYKVVYHFRIPFTQICNSTIHIVGLYPINAISNRDDASAYYLFAEDNTWKPIDVPDSVGNFSIVIDWTLELENKRK